MGAKLVRTQGRVWPNSDGECHCAGFALKIGDSPTHCFSSGSSANAAPSSASHQAIHVRVPLMPIKDHIPYQGRGNQHQKSSHSMFSGAHFHLLVNHAPIFGSLFALALLVASYFTSADVLRKTAFVILIATAIAGHAADLSGDAAEDAIRGFPGVKRDVIHAHEDMAERAYIFADILGVLALAGLVRWRRRPVPAGAIAAAVLATAFVGGAMIYTGLLGGRIRHTEVRPGATEADAITIEPRRPRPPQQPGN
jgi:hypothetical protein